MLQPPTEQWFLVCQYRYMRNAPDRLLTAPKCGPVSILPARNGVLVLNRLSIFAAAAMALVAAPACAADMPVKASPTAIAAAYNWTGWYVGGNVGYGWANNTGGLWDSQVDTPTVAIAGYFALGGNVLPGVKPSGVIGGAQAGYNWQAASWVLGVVADIQAADMQAFGSATVTPGVGSTTIQTNNARIDWFGTVRGKVGYAANNWLFYGTGGVAYGQVKSSLAFNCVGCIPQTLWAGATSSTQVGWAAGAGIEVGLSPNWTAGVEYLHIDLGSISTTAFPDTAIAAGSSVSANSKFAADMVRATLNYKFSPAVVAKY